MRAHLVHYPLSFRFPGRGVICGTKNYTVVSRLINDATCLRCIALGPECERAAMRKRALQKRRRA